MAKINDKRSVVVVGVTGCGKSTICNKIFREECFTVAQGFQTVTASVECKGRQVEIQGETIDLTIVDTVGLSDAHGRSLDSMKELKEKIKEIGGINLILFVIRYSRLTDAEARALKLIDEHLNHLIGRFSAVVITGCEYLDANGRKKAIEQLKNDTITGKFASNMALDVHTVGFPDIKSFPEHMQKYFTEIAENDTKEMHKLIYRTGAQYSYDQMFTVGCLENLSMTWEALKAIFTKQ